MSNFLDSGWPFLILVIVAVIMLILGFDMGRVSASDDCKDYGAFTVNKTKYQCVKDNRYAGRS